MMGKRQCFLSHELMGGSAGQMDTNIVYNSYISLSQ